MKYNDRPRTRETFTLTGVEHRGAKGLNQRLVCFVEGHSGLLALWGTIGADMRNIQQVEHAGFSVTIECDWIEPDEYEAAHFSHRYWVPQDAYLKIQRDVP